MEMPVQCPKCKEIIELDETRESKLSKKLLCKKCCSEENQIKDLIEEAKDIQYGLDNNEDYVKGDRRGWKKNLKDIKNKISEFGYNYDDYI